MQRNDATPFSGGDLKRQLFHQLAEVIDSRIMCFKDIFHDKLVEITMILNKKEIHEAQKCSFDAAAVTKNGGKIFQALAKTFRTLITIIPNIWWHSKSDSHPQELVRAGQS